MVPCSGRGRRVRFVACRLADLFPRARSCGISGGTCVASHIDDARFLRRTGRASRPHAFPCRVPGRPKCALRVRRVRDRGHVWRHPAKKGTGFPMTHTGAYPLIIECPVCGSDGAEIRHDIRSSLIYSCQQCEHEWQIDPTEEDRMRGAAVLLRDRRDPVRVDRRSVPRGGRRATDVKSGGVVGLPR